MLDPWQFVVVVLAAFRVVRFVVFDKLVGAHLESRSKFSRRLDTWAYDQNGQDRSFVRGKVGDLLTCPWCIGFWISLAVWAAFWWGPEWVQYATYAWAVAGAVALISAYERRMSRG